MRFLRSLPTLRKIGLTRHNIRALWIQSDRQWFRKWMLTSWANWLDSDPEGLEDTQAILDAIR